MKSDIRLYSAQDIDELPIPKDPLAQRAYWYTIPMIKNGTVQYVDNIRTDLRLLKCSELYLPVTINSTDWDNSYVCSPYTHYISYAKEELVQLPIKFLRIALRPLLDRAGAFLKKRDFNRVVIVNNWMLSTNLHPTISLEKLDAITRYLRDKFPTHAIVFRSVNVLQHHVMLSSFQKLGYLLVGSRQVYISDTRQPEMLSAHARKHLNADKHQLDKYNNTSQIDEPSEATAQRVTQLYNMLYIDKYSRNNPQFNAKYMQHASETGAIKFTGLMRDGILVGIAGMFSFGDMISAPILGYDTALPQKEALYRRLSSITYQSATKIRAVFNNSSGASGFKRNRGFAPTIEYSAVYVSHLPHSQQHGWRVVRTLVNILGIPAMKLFKL